MNATFRIFISSPGDVGREREVAYRVIERVEAWFGGRVKLEGYFWEHEPMRTTRGDFQENIPEPATFDLVVCILWSRLGSRLPSRAYTNVPTVLLTRVGRSMNSKTPWRHSSAMGRPDLLVYRRTEMPLFPPEPREEMEARLRQWEALKAFCERWFRDDRENTFTAAFNPYKDSGDFERAFEEHLKRLVEERLTKSGGAAALRRDGNGGGRDRRIAGCRFSSSSTSRSSSGGQRRVTRCSARFGPDGSRRSAPL